MKWLYKFLPLVLLICLLLLFGCQSAVPLIADLRDYADCPAQKLAGREIVMPDTITYIKNGAETVLSKGEAAYEQVLELNTARLAVSPRLGELLLVLPENLDKGQYLVYEYTNRAYAPVCFSMEQEGGDWAYSLQTKDTNVYGLLAPAEELLAYLDTL